MTTKKMFLGAMAALALSSGLAMPPAVAQTYDDDPYTVHTLALAQVSDPADRINNVAVETPSGAYAGEVRSVRTNFFGEATRIGIALRDNRWVWVDAADMRFDPQRHVVRSNLTYGELEDMSI